MSDKKLQIKDFEKNNYFATQELVDVVNAALFLDKPLLIEGPVPERLILLSRYQIC